MIHTNIKAIAFGIAATFASAGSHAATNVQFALDWKFEGPSAPYFLAIDNGHFSAAGLEVEISLGISGPGDLEGSVLGAPPPDGAWAQFPSFAKANNIDIGKIKVEPVGFPTREPMLAEGKVDSVTGFSFSSYLNLVRLGVPENDISTILMADHGLKLYGNAVIVNTEYAAANGDTVKAFLAAVAAGWKDAIADPTAAAAALAKRNPAADAALEERRLKLAIDANVLTDYVKANGMGGIDTARFAAAVDQLSETYDYKTAPNAALYFTDAYLPSGGFKVN